MNLQPEPQIVPDQPITVDLFRRLRNSMEEFSRFGWQCGLLPTHQGQPAMDLKMEPQDVIHLYHLHAIGVNGYPFLVPDGPHHSGLPPFDTSGLGVGRYSLYICRAERKTPAGEIIEFRPQNGAEMRRYQSDLVPRLILELDEDRLQHLDWLKVAVFDRHRENGIVRTYLDMDFHPPISDMAAYLGANPLPRLVEVLLEAVGEAPEDSLSGLLHIELDALVAIAEQGDPQVVFLQTQRCLSLARLTQSNCPVLEANLERVRYSPESFCRFLRTLNRLLDGHKLSAYPDVLELGETRYLRVDGEFLQEGDYWVWRPQSPEFIANGLALYMPYATASVPYISYGNHREESADWPLAEVATDLSHPGSAAILDKTRNQIDEVYLRTNNLNQAQNLRLKLGEGHAVYYF